jgi:epsilon-lactone hydrolase
MARTTSAHGAHGRGWPPEPAAPYDPVQRPSQRGRVARWLLRLFFRPLFLIGAPRGLMLAVIRFVVDHMACRPDRDALIEAAVENNVRCVWVTAPTAAGVGTVLYLHGGGYLVGSPKSHAGLAARISACSGLRVCLPDYRLSPGHPHPAAADDALAVYRALLASGVDPHNLVVAGDSAGGHLAACLINDAKRSGLPLPAALVLWSPLIDPQCTAAIAADRRRRDPVLATAFWLPGLRAHFAGIDDLECITPLAGVDGRWPPTLIQAGTDECLLDDARNFANALESAGVLCELQIWPGQVHVFQTLDGLVPEARRAIAETGRFVRQAVSGFSAD